MIKQIVLVVLLIIAIESPYSNAQDNQIERVKSELSKLNSNISKYNHLDKITNSENSENELVFSAHYLKGIILRSEGKSVEALAQLKLIAENEGASEFPVLLGDTYLEISEIYMEQESLDLAENFLNEAFILFDGSDEIIKKALVLIKTAHVAKKSQDFQKAIRHLNHAYDIYMSQNDNLRALETAKELGIIAYQAGEFTSAEKFFKISLAGYEESGEYQEQIKVYESLSKLYGFEKEHGKQIEVQNKLIEIASEHTSSSYLASKFEEISITYSKANQSRNALVAQQKAVTHYEPNQSKELYRAELRLSELYKLNKRETDAILTLHRANAVAVSLDNEDLIIESTRIISDFYSKRENWQKAHEFLTISDSLSVVRYQRQLSALQNSEQSELQKVQSESEIAQDSSGLPVLTFPWKLTMASTAVIFLGILLLLLRASRRKRKIRQILEWKVYKRTKELRMLNSELNTYIYKSSHDLRNPLTSIKSLISLLKTESLDETPQKYVGLIDDCANQMDEILLNLSRAVDYKRLEVKVQQVNFSGIQSEMEKLYNPDIAGLDISWSIREKAPFFSDISLIKVILNKTIGNSIQYRMGSSNDFCKVSITTDSAGAHVCVEDNGQGIAEKVKDSVFDMFVKGTHKSKGAGLGLYLVKIASEKIRARITLETKENNGSKLMFQIPNLA